MTDILALGAKWSKDLQWFRYKAMCGDGQSTVADVITAYHECKMCIQGMKMS
jgi:hypothetical protein